jgi:hypothetical protein
MYISNGQCADFPAFSDAVMSAGDGDDSSEVGLTGEGGPEGSSSFDATEHEIGSVTIQADGGDAPLLPDRGSGDSGEADEGGFAP